MGSNRLPGKVLKSIGDRPLLAHVLDRLKKLYHPATVVVATSTEPADDQIEKFCKERGETCFRGSELNVLDRYYRAAVQYGMDPVVRLTADNPFVDVNELDRLLVLRTQAGAEYAHSFPSLPVGVGAEVFTFRALETSHREGHESHHLEHVNEFIQENPQRFPTSVLEVSPNKNRPEVRLTVDTLEDYRRACFVAENATFPVSTQEAIRLCSQFA
ncbi:MAG: hypothetical protein KC553_01445 [Nitrospina sp.]|nr:hypothetical protein [Nitrospina sp.]